MLDDGSGRAFLLYKLSDFSSSFLCTIILLTVHSINVHYLVKCGMSFSQIEEEANGDLFDIEINVSDPEKVGKFLEPSKSDDRLFYPLKTMLRF